MGGLPGGVGLLLDLVQFGMVAAAMAATFHYLPNTHVRWGHAWMGGLFVAVCLEIAKRLLAYYLSKVPTYSVVYGAFATLPILLVWIYMTWSIVLLGAVLVASWTGLTMGHVRDPQLPGADFQLALDTLRELNNSRVGKSYGAGLRELSVRLNADPLQMQQVLEQLQQLDWVGLLNEDNAGKAPRYVLLVDANSVLVEPLMTQLLLAYEPGSKAVHQQWRDRVLADFI